MAYDNQGAAIGAAGHYASVITAAFITAGVITTPDEAVSSFNSLLADTFDACETLKGEQPAAAAPAPRRRASSSGGGGARRSSGGSNEGKAPGDYDFKDGTKYGGKTIAEVYGLGDEGVEYLEWTASDANRNEFMRRKAQAFLAEAA